MAGGTNWKKGIESAKWGIGTGTKETMVEKGDGSSSMTPHIVVPARKPTPNSGVDGVCIFTSEYKFIQPVTNTASLADYPNFGTTLES